ncbi:ABC1 kinase family protein [Ferdinandcohnia quinoae]|uniref:AarF/UbiB family protein n=1 Tax=Fredinandcohnia quinoae TaxID=2918902 RepID=A0AAW5DVA4_9BACI|nr:AarF/UbiB family protein [Fredinandcohnia sp. SECRCQ15]MCH1624278.1 AarF/UbiB family protein [Fredinandcohnia sp. SECRCQ15]
MKSNRKLIRMYKVLSMAFSIFIQVYWYKLTKKPEHEWEKLWEKVGKTFRTTLFDLEGLLIKIGQLLSIRGDLLPNAFIRQIQDLVDKVPPSPWEDIKEILEKEWNGSIEQRVRSINTQSIASASIGEVFQGVLNDGTLVAIKVQRPNIRSIVQTDFHSLAIIIWFAHYFAPVPKGFINFKVLFQELKQVIERELDFEKEMEAALYFQEHFKELNGLKIPSFYPDLCTSRVLVMEWIDGIKVTELEKLGEHQINRKEMAQRLLLMFLPQWLEAGLFHADPHAGNILIRQDGTIVLLDFGMVGEISKKDADTFQRLVEGVLVKNYPAVIECLSDLGFLLPNADDKMIEKLLAEWLSFDLTKLENVDLFALKREMNDVVRALPIQVPTRFVFLGRSFVTIEGMVHTIAPDEDQMDVWKPTFIEWIKQQGGNKWDLIWKWINSQPLFKVFHSIGEILQTPQKLEEMKETEQRRQFQFTIYENQKKYAFQLSLLSAVGIMVGIHLGDSLIWKISSGALGLSLIGYFLGSYKQRKWLKYMQNRR